MQEILSVIRDYLEYEADTGDFYWIKDTNPRGPSKVGTRAGVINALQYIVIGFGRQRLLGHKLAWFFVHDYWPEWLDHINGRPWDNRLINLRECTQSQNIANANYGENRGVELHGAKYRVRVVVNGVRHEVGSYSTIEEARIASREAHIRFFGEYSYFARSVSLPNQ